MAADDTRVTVGRVGRPFGVKGWVKINSFTQPIGNILNYQPWIMERDGEEIIMEVKESHVRGNEVVVQFADSLDRESAKYYTGNLLTVPRDQLPELDQDEYYWADLEGLQVINQDGCHLGTVDYVFETGSNDVMVVKQERERLIPFLLHDVVQRIDLKNKVISVDWDPDF